MEENLTLQEAVYYFTKVKSWDDLLWWLSVLPLWMKIAFIIGALGVALALWRFIWATLPYSD